MELLSPLDCQAYRYLPEIMDYAAAQEDAILIQIDDQLRDLRIGIQEIVDGQVVLSYPAMPELRAIRPLEGGHYGVVFQFADDSEIRAFDEQADAPGDYYGVSPDGAIVFSLTIQLRRAREDAR